MDKVTSRISQFIQRRNRRQVWTMLISFLALAVGLLTAVALLLTASAQTRQTYCGQDHEHTLQCYSNPKADIETQKKWGATLPTFEKDAPSVSKLVAIAKSQINYAESTANYEVHDDGTIAGYTRYGAWNGTPYASWNALFVNFSLEHAGIDTGLFLPKEKEEDGTNIQEESDDVQSIEQIEQGELEEPGQNDAEQYEVVEEVTYYEGDDGTIFHTREEAEAAGYEIEDEEQGTLDGPDSPDAEDGVLTEDSLEEQSTNDSEAQAEDEQKEYKDEPLVEPETWQRRLRYANLYVAVADKDDESYVEGFVPQAGDFVFVRVNDDKDNVVVSSSPTASNETNVISLGVDNTAVSETTESSDQDEASEASEQKHILMGIVLSVNTQRGKMRVAIGDLDGKVAQKTYRLSSNHIEGYGKLPEELRSEKKAYDEAQAEAKAKSQAQAEAKAQAESVRKRAESEQAKQEDQDHVTDKGEQTPEEVRLEEEVPQVLVAQTDGFRISVNMGKQAQAGYTLEAKPLKATKKRIASVEEGLSEQMPDGATKQAHVDAQDVVLFDIRVVDESGNEVAFDKSVRVSVEPMDAPIPATESTVPEVVHLGSGEPEVLPAKAQDEGFTFTTDAFSPFAFVYTVDFAYEGYEWSMPGGSGSWLSAVLEQLQADVDLAQVTDVEFSNPKLVRVAGRDTTDGRDWLLTSLKPFDTKEKLTLTLADGSTAVIDVTDESTEQDIRHRLDRVEFYDGDTLVGDTMSPDSMVVRAGHEYTMRLYFSENEHLDDPSIGQFPDDGLMRYDIPSNVHLSKKAFDANNRVTFDIVLDRKHTLTGNVVTYHEASGANPAYITIQWNTQDKDLYKLLKASPRTAFSLSFPYTTIDVDGNKPIEFSSSAILNVEGDPTYDVALEKTATPQTNNPEIIDYEVTAIADGNVEDVLFTDVMGEALTYAYTKGQESSGVQVTYKQKTGEDADGKPIYVEYATLPSEYADANKQAFTVTEGDHGFSFKLHKLNNSDMAVIKYSAHVDYTKLGGKNNIETTSKNTVTAKDNQNNLLAEASQALDKNLDYLQLGKQRGEIQYVGIDENNNEVDITDLGNKKEDDYPIANNWKYMYVKWNVIYNPDHLISVEGATLKDTIWMGRKFATTYATDKPFKVTAYESGTFTKDDGSKGDSFTSESTGHVIIDPTEENGYGWNDAKGDVTVTVADSGTQQLSSWEWTIPQIGATDGLADQPYTYVIEYWTKIAKDGDTGGYVGNQVTESIADITRDKSVELPGIGPDWAVTIDKEHVVDDYDDKDGKVFSQWKVTFNRRDFSLERAIVEDTLPHLKISKEKSADGVERILRDTFVDVPISEDSVHGWKVEGLFNEANKIEQCVPSVSADGYDVVFWFFKNQNKIENPDINTPGQGLYGAGADATDEQKKITITYWTENDKEWIEASAEGKAANEHWNHVHLVLNGKENVDNEFGVPKPKSEIKKRVEEAGSWTDGNTTLPVYRYTLSLNGLTDDAFIPVEGEEGKYNLVITDEFNGILDYLPKDSLPSCVDSEHMTSDLDGTAGNKALTLAGRSSSDEVLVRPVPKTDPHVEWPATFDGPTDSSSEGDGKKKITITIPVTEDQRKAMKYQVLGQDGKPYMVPKNPNDPNSEQKEVWVYAKTYEVSYYLAPDFQKVKDKAQAMVDAKQYENTTLTFENEATWEHINGEAGKSTFTAKTDYDLKPVKKKLLNYNSETEVATYSIEINPLKLTMNSGQRYSVQDSYENMAVDFQTVKFETDPAGLEDTIEWSYHGNKGTFWVPDETKVTVTYEGWPVGKRSGNDLVFKNTATIGGYVDEASKTAKLAVDHEGYASTYRVRVFKFADDNMDKPLPGAVFQLFENGPDGKIRPMTYKAEHSSSIDDDIMWQTVNTDREKQNLSTYPTPENHKVGDNIYFVTGNGKTGSAQAGFADVMLSQSRDGVSLKKNKQYYLREVVEPNGYIKEDIDWRFIIGDNDDWDRYVYSDDSILQVSNTSVDPVLTVRKTFVDRSNNVTIDYNNHEKDVQFVIKGRDLNDSTKIIYTKTVTYGDFMRVYKTKEDGTVERDEYVLTIHDLPAGTYTVREVRDSATVTDTVLTTYVEGSASAHNVDKEGKPNPSETETIPVPTSAQNSGATSGDTVFTFNVLKNESTDPNYLTKTTANAEFTNIYTDEDPVSVTINKSWPAGGMTNYTPKRTEYVLYADNEKYPLTPAQGGNENGNIVLLAGNSSSDNWANSITITGLPKKKTAGGPDIQWTVEEVGATYRIHNHENDTTVSGFLREHFEVNADTDFINNNTYQRELKTDEQTGNKSVSFTNELNSLVTVKIKKQWSDNNTSHSADSIFFDLYRTKDQSLRDYHEDDIRLRARIANEELSPVIENIELNEANNWEYVNDLLDKYDQNDTNARWQYFALERSVAGYKDSYYISDDSEHNQDIVITNTPLENNPRGRLSISKSVTDEVPADFAKTYKFTLWNSGKYLHEDGTLSNERYEFEVQAGAEAEPTVFENVKLGTYVLTEVLDDAQIGGYTLNSTTVAVNGDEAVNVTDKGLESEVVVTESQTTGSAGEQTHTAENVVVTNTYTKDANPPKTSFTFGKLWVMPNPDDSTTLEWPKNVSTTMQVQRRVKGTKKVDESFKYEYVLSKGSADNTITATQPSVAGAPQLTVNNPDVDTSASSAANYHHYTFTLNDLEQYDAYGSEWEYFATETAIKDTTNNVDLLDKDNSTGRSFSTEYGHVDGIGAYSYQQDADAESKTDASMTANGIVECAINRLAISQTVDIPVQKFINGTADWGATTGSNTASYPQFSFTLYDEFGNPVLDKSKNPDGVHITVTTNEKGQALFTLPETLIDPNEMIWWPDAEILYGSHTFWIKEDDLAKPAAAGALDMLYEYYGIERFTGSAKVTLTVRYDWKTSTLTSTARVSNGEYTHTDAQHREWAVINNAYKTEETQLKVTKTWDDANNQDGYREPVKFKVSASYVTQDPATGQNIVHPLDKVWLNKVVKTSSGSKIVREDDIVLNNDSDRSKEYRIVVESDDDNQSTFSTTVKLPKYYEGHVIKYTVEEMPLSENADNKYEKTPAVARIGETYYPTLREAINTAAPNATIELLADDASLAAEGITISKNLTINGNNHTVTGSTSSPCFTIQSGDVTISDLVMTTFGTSPVSTESSYTGTLKLNNVDVSSFSGTAFSLNGGTYNINGGTINGGTGNTGISTSGTATGTVDGTTIRGENGIVNESTGTVTLSNVDVVVSGTGIKATAGTVSIPKGNATENNTYVKAASNNALVKEGEGTFSVEVGTYSNKVPSDCCATGYVPSGQLDNGLWTVQWGQTAVPPVASNLIYNGQSQTGVASGTGYTVSDTSSATNADKYTATLTLDTGYRWSDGTTGTKQIEWTIGKATIDVPTAATGLVYNGEDQTGVAAGTSYTVTGNTGKDADSYKATVTTDNNHQFSDGSTSKEVDWSIAKAPVTVQANDASKKAGEDDPTPLTATVTGTFGSDAVSYDLVRDSGDIEGRYTITASGEAEQDNYTVEYMKGTFTILPSGLSANAVAYTITSEGVVTAHTTLANAIAAASAENDHTVHLLKDVELDATLPVNNKVIIDGSNNGNKFTIKPLASAASINPLISVSASGDLTLGNVIVDAKGTGNNVGRAIVVKSGKLTLNDGAKVTGGSTATSYIGGVYMTGTSVFIMNGGEITGNHVSEDHKKDYLQYSADLWIGSEAKGTMNGGKVDNLFVNSNDWSKPAAGFTQNGGTITNAYLEYDKAKASLTYNDGKLENLYIAQEDADEHGGKHTTSPEHVTTLVKGATYAPGSGTIRLQSTSGTVRDYDSLEEAINDAKSGDRIALLKDTTVSSMIILDKSLTIDLYGNTLSGTGEGGKVFQVVNDETLTIEGSTPGSEFVGRLNAGAALNNNGNITLNGGTYSCGDGQTVLHVNGTCTNSNVTITNAAITSPTDNGIQLNGAGTHSITNSTISGKTAVYLKAGTLTVTDSTLRSTASGHTNYSYNGNGSNPTGDAVVVDSCTYPGGNPTLHLGAGNTINVANNSNMQVGYYEANTGATGYKPGVVTAHSDDATLPDGYTWVEQSNGSYKVSTTYTVAFDSAGAGAVESQQIADGHHAKKPANPERPGKKFLGWFATGEDTPFDFDNKAITADTILTAKWEDAQFLPTGDPQYTNKHVPEKINVSVEKLWDHNGGTPESDLSVKVFLKATYTKSDDTEVVITHDNINDYTDWSAYRSSFDEVTLSNASNVWKNTWSNLPRYALGEVGALVKYTVEENAETIPIGYKVTRDNGSGTAEPGKTDAQTITNEYVPVSIPTLKKEWDDDDNRDGLRPESVTYQLTATAGDKDVTNLLKYKDGTDVSTTPKTLTGSTNTWSTAGWTDLPGYYQGKLITYKVTETTVPNYTATDITASAENPATSDPTITNTHEIDRTQVKLTKLWKDNANQDGKRPSIADYVRTFVRFTSQSEGGTPIELVIGSNPIEVGSNQYYLYQKNGSTVSSDPYETGGEKAIATLVGSHEHGTAGDDYIITYSKLPVKENQGKAITYNVVETDDAGHELKTGSGYLYKNLSTDASKSYHDYEISVDMTHTSGGTDSEYTVTNKYEPETLSISATKQWEKAGTTFSEGDIADLNRKVRLKLVAKENGVPLTEEEILSWQTLDHPYTVETTKTPSASGVVTWNGLPKHDPKGVKKVIEYSIEEIQAPEGYHMTSEPVVNLSGNESTKTITVTNTYEEASVTATKTWDDANNQDGLRNEVAFKLQERVGDATAWRDVNGKDQKTITALNPLDVSWTELPAWKNNQRVHYHVVEVPPASSSQTDIAAYLDSKYTVTPNGFTDPEATTSGNLTVYPFTGSVTNHHDPATKNVTFTKQWDHKGASDYLTRAQLKEKLHLWARVGTDAPQEVANATSTGVVNTNWFQTNWKEHLTVSDDYVVTITGLPTNKPQSAEVAAAEPLQYFITEDPVPNYTVDYDTGNTGAGRVSGKTGEGETLTNTRDTGSLTIDKTVVSDLAADASLDFTFNVTSEPKITGDYTVSYSGGSTNTLTFDSNGKATGSVKLKGSESITINGLPTGVKYTVTEEAHNDFTTSSNPADGIVTSLTKDQTSIVSFTNTRKTGELDVSKTVISTVQGDKTRTYDFNIILTGLSETARNKTYNGTLKTTGSTDEAKDVRFTDGVAQVGLAHGQTLQIIGLPTGATYAVEELSTTPGYENYDVTKTGDSGTVTTTASTAAFTNTRKTGKLKLSKVVNSPFATERNAYYTFNITLTLPNEQLTTDLITFNLDTEAGSKVTPESMNVSGATASNTINIRLKIQGGHSVIIGGLPAGVTYTVEETDLDSSVLEGQTTYGNDTKSITSQTTDTVTTTNSRHTLPISIMKVSAEDHEKGLDGAEFVLALSGAEMGSEWHAKTLVSNAGGYLADADIADADSSNKTSFNLPLGTYTLTETKAPVGYHKLSAPATFKITASGVQYTDSIMGNSEDAVTTNPQQGDAVLLKVANSTGYELPSTGGMGTGTIYALGTALICIAVISKKRMSKRA